jgi:DNA polymerase III delta subunit
MDFFALDKGLKEGKIPRVLYLFGDEPYLIERGIEGLRTKIIPAHLQEFNRDVRFQHPGSLMPRGQYLC